MLFISFDGYFYNINSKIMMLHYVKCKQALTKTVFFTQGGSQYLGLFKNVTQLMIITCCLPKIATN